MSESHGALERARHRVDPAWSPRKLEEQLGRLEVSIEARKRRPLAGVLVIALSGCVAAAFLMLYAPAPGRQNVATRSTAEPSLTASPSIAPRVANTPSVTAVEATTREQPEEVSAQGPIDTLATEAPKAQGSPVKRRSTRVRVASTVWHSLAREGRYHEAYRAMRGSEPDRVRAEVDELLLAGDAARLSGHAREAVPFYRAALDRAGKGPRAHLAAFTLGRTLLNELHDPLAAAEAFARAYAAAPRGPLAEEALAREAESWRRAGDATRARAATERYQAAYPQGRLLRR
jgi:TolA-binding protein